MNISHDGVTVYFKTAPEELFLAEKSGAKPNTVCIIDNDEYELLNTRTPKKIGIRYQEELFLRTLTNLHFAKLFGKVIVIFSWEHPHTPEHTHVDIVMDPYLPLSHSMSFDGNAQLRTSEGATPPGPHSVSTIPGEPCNEKFHVITISTQTLAILQDLAHGHSMDSAIRLLHDAYLNRKTSTWRSRHD